ncbi:hypothetical protein [Halobacillus sp. H74]|uniref:hypothetical protein n=1 Tax=Halobacillus sp. H74 TaxID=3457436 RepID=UPI003FCDDD1A
MENLIEGVRFSDRCLVKYGEEFPEAGQSLQADLPNYGICELYVEKVGSPKWIDRNTVAVVTEYYIKEVIDPNDKYKRRKIEKSGLTLIK